ncbi:MAG: DUF3037 domain-containing protein [Bacteroidota bacterium]
MQDKQVFEYAIIRVLPRVERGEFVNAGVVVYCKKQQFLKAMIQLDEQRIKSLYKEADVLEISNHLKAFEQICLGNKAAGPIAALDVPSRFRWLTAKRSTVIQASEIHPGLCTDPKAVLEKLFTQMVVM